MHIGFRELIGPELLRLPAQGVSTPYMYRPDVSRSYRAHVKSLCSPRLDLAVVFH